MQVSDKVRIVSQCCDHGRTGTVVSIDRSAPCFTHKVKLDNPTDMDESLASWIGESTVPYAPEELEVLN